MEQAKQALDIDNAHLLHRRLKIVYITRALYKH